jgi:hypothetical protein
MKQKKILMLSLLVGLFSLFSFSFAQNISFSVEWESSFGNWCLVPIDIYVDTQEQEISALDLMMETSLVYKDFVPTSIFPYYLPPVVRSNGLLHIVGFTVDPAERVIWSGKIWTIYFEQKSWFSDGTVRLYFLWEGNTTDSNLSKAGWIDVLKKVSDIYVTFSSDLPVCEHAAAVLTWWFAGMTYQDSLNSTMQKIYDKYGKLSFWMFLQNNIFFVITLLLLIIVVLVLIYRKQLLSYFHKDLVWKKSTQ